MKAGEPLQNWKVLGIAAQLLEAHDTAKRLYRERYDEMVEPYRKVLRSFVSAGGGPTLDTARRLLETLQARPEDTSISQMLVMAATVDVLGPEEVVRP